MLKWDYLHVRLRLGHGLHLLELLHPDLVLLQLLPSPRLNLKKKYVVQNIS